MSRIDVQHTRGLQPAVSTSAQIKERGAAILELDTQRLKVGDGAGTVGSLEYWIDPKVRKLTAIDCGVVEGGIEAGKFILSPLADNGLANTYFDARTVDTFSGKAGGKSSHNIAWIDSLEKFVFIEHNVNTKTEDKYAKIFLSDDGVNWTYSDTFLDFSGLCYGFRYIREKNLLVIFCHGKGGIYYCYPEKDVPLDIKYIEPYSPLLNRTIYDVCWCAPLGAYMACGDSGCLWKLTENTEDGTLSAGNAVGYDGNFLGGNALIQCFWDDGLGYGQAFAGGSWSTTNNKYNVRVTSKNLTSVSGDTYLNPQNVVTQNIVQVKSLGGFYAYKSSGGFIFSNNGYTWVNKSGGLSEKIINLQYIDEEECFLANGEKHIYFSKDCVDWNDVTDFSDEVRYLNRFAYSPKLRRLVGIAQVTETQENNLIIYDF